MKDISDNPIVYDCHANISNNNNSSNSSSSSSSSSSCCCCNKSNCNKYHKMK